MFRYNDYYNYPMHADHFDSGDFDYYKDDIVDALEGKKIFMNVQRISPVHFLRDRELGLRISRTSNHVVGQRVRVLTEPPINWPYPVRGEIYRRLLDECVKEDEEFDYTSRILRKMLCFGKALHISIDIDIGKCVELVILNNLRPSQYKSWKYPRHIGNVRKNCADDDLKVLRCAHLDVLDRCFQRYKCIFMHSRVQDSERYCLSCAKVTCKCSVENCDIVF